VTSPTGIRIQVYCAIIACLLLSLWTGRKPTKATLEMFYYYFSGLAEEDELEAHLAKTETTRRLSSRTVAPPRRPPLHAAHAPTAYATFPPPAIRSALTQSPLPHHPSSLQSSAEQDCIRPSRFRRRQPAAFQAHRSGSSRPVNRLDGGSAKTCSAVAKRAES